MLNSMFFLQFHGFSGGGFRDILIGLEQLGFFDYILPFLIIFALVFGILTKIKIFEENKGINAIIALSVGLMALQFGFVSVFFAELFPRLGIGLAIILSVLILVGLFFDTEGQAMNYILLGVGVIILIVVLASTAEASSWWYSWSFLSGNLGGILLTIGIILVMVVIVASANSTSQTKYKSILMDGFGK